MTSTEGTMPVLKTQNLGIQFGGLKAVDSFNMEIGESEMVGLIGPNGAGKTTILRTISGLKKADKGEINFDGADLIKTEPSKIINFKLAHVPEGRHIFPQMTVEENLEMGAFTDGKDMAANMADVFERFPD